MKRALAMLPVFFVGMTGCDVQKNTGVPVDVEAEAAAPAVRSAQPNIVLL